MKDARDCPLRRRTALGAWTPALLLALTALVWTAACREDGGAPPSGEEARQAVSPPAADGISVERALVAEPVTGERTALYATIRNRGRVADTLVGLRSDAARRAEIHRYEEAGESRRMVPAPETPVPGGGVLRLEPGGHHGMLMGLEGRLAAGDTLRATFLFRRAGDIEVTAEVVPYAELEDRLEGGG